MRMMAVLGLMLLALPAMAQDGLRHEDRQFGFAFEVPAGFVASGGGAAGQSFEMPGERVTLWVAGQRLCGPFGAAVARQGRELEAQGWRLGEQTLTPDWASLSASKGSRMRFARTILLCDRQSLATWQIELSAAQFSQFAPVLDRLGRALRAVGC